MEPSEASPLHCAVTLTPDVSPDEVLLIFPLRVTWVVNNFSIVLAVSISFNEAQMRTDDHVLFHQVTTLHSGIL